jgi:hypothetical protein
MVKLSVMPLRGLLFGVRLNARLGLFSARCGTASRFVLVAASRRPLMKDISMSSAFLIG